MSFEAKVERNVPTSPGGGAAPQREDAVAPPVQSSGQGSPLSARDALQVYGDMYSGPRAVQRAGTAAGGSEDVATYTMKEEPNGYQVWVTLAKTQRRTAMSWAEFQQLNEARGVSMTTLHPGDKLYYRRDASSLDAPKEKEEPPTRPEPTATVKDSALKVSGDPRGKKLVRIAWTVDDGPQKETQNMMNTMDARGVLSAGTWYIQRNRLGSPAQWAKLQSMQKQGIEIAIHSFHKTADHSTFFPISKGSSAYSFPYAGKSMDAPMGDLTSFCSELSGKGINCKFIRAPGGLLSELAAYAADQGTKAENKVKVAQAVLAGDTAAAKRLAPADAVDTLTADLARLKTTLNTLGLLHWGGDSDAGAFHDTTWNAEASGDKSRTDNITDHKHDGGDSNRGRFEQTVNGMRAGQSRTFVVLSHDTTANDVKEVGEDIKQIEDFAKANAVRLEWGTMSQIFEATTGKDAASYKPSYR